MKASRSRRGIRLIDRADMCQGHFCLGRQFNGNLIKYWVFWSDTYKGGSWCSAGTVYVGKEAALKKRAWILTAEKQRREIFNWRGNRPRMGKRAMCGVCGCLIHCQPMAECPQCGSIDTMHDVSYDNPKPDKPRPKTRTSSRRPSARQKPHAPRKRPRRK